MEERGDAGLGFDREHALAKADRGAEIAGFVAAGERVVLSRLAGVERERGEIHEVHDVRVHAGLADDRTAVRVADEHDVASDRLDGGAHARGVVVQGRIR